MFKQVITLFRGAAHDASEDFTDRNAIPLLRQQIRDASAALLSARKAVAIAMVQHEQEQKQHKNIIAQIKDLEARTFAALEQGQEALAQEAAETISLLEAERDASQMSLDQSASEIERLKAMIRRSEMKIKELDRGQRLAVATDKTQRLREAVPHSGLSALNDAESTLKRLRTRQQQVDRSAELMDELAATGDPEAVKAKLAKAGCGASIESSANDVLKRLKQKMDNKKGEQDSNQDQ